MKYYLYLIIIICSCATLKPSNIKKDILIYILNEKVKLPLNDQTACSDTILFQIFNNSKYEYFFDIVDTTGFFFLNEKSKEGDFIDPFGGFGIGFLDKNGNHLKSDGNNVFYPEGFDDVVIKEVVYKLLPQKSITIKVPLIFPSKLDFGNYIQRIPSIHQTSSVEILFRPENGYLKNILLKNGKLKLNRNQKVMNISKYFVLPVEFECQ